MIHCCDICDYEVRHKENVSKHIESAHESINFACEHCDHKGKNNINHHKHIKLLYIFLGLYIFLDVEDFKLKIFFSWKLLPMFILMFLFL